MLNSSETLETSTQRFGINILQTPEKFKGTSMPIRTTEEKNEESLTMVKASSNVRRNARHVKELTHLENLYQKQQRHLPGNMWNLWKTRSWIKREATSTDFKLLQPYKKKREQIKLQFLFNKPRITQKKI